MPRNSIVRGAYLQTNAFMQQTLAGIDTARNLTKILWEPFVSYFATFIFEKRVVEDSLLPLNFSEEV